MNYRSVADMNDTIMRNLHRLPRDSDVVVGIPRSGLLAANLISLARNLPLADLDGFLAGRLLSAGKTRRRPSFDGRTDEFQNVLLVDDSVFTGDSMRAAAQRVRRLAPARHVHTCAVYAPTSEHLAADIVLEAVRKPRMFQWNIMHHKNLDVVCMDIDGVLCVDPTDAQNDDASGYEAFLSNAIPLLVPTRPIGCLVTSRLEKYRPQTEAWLRRCSIQYHRLEMLSLPSKAERQRLGMHARFKADVYRHSNAILFIESEYAQAKVIAKLAGKPVLCIEAQQIIRPEPLTPLAMAQALRTLPTRLKASHSPLTSAHAVKTAMRHLLGEEVYGELKDLLKHVRKRSSREQAHS